MPFAIIQRNKDLIQRNGIDKLNRAFGRLKRAIIANITLRSAIDPFRAALSDKGAIPPHTHTHPIHGMEGYCR